MTKKEIGALILMFIIASFICFTLVFFVDSESYAGTKPAVSDITFVDLTEPIEFNDGSYPYKLYIKELPLNSIYHLEFFFYTKHRPRLVSTTQTLNAAALTMRTDMSQYKIHSVLLGDDDIITVNVITFPKDEEEKGYFQHSLMLNSNPPFEVIGNWQTMCIPHNRTIPIDEKK